jgi:glyoxylase-like metal-dependent hydrolase (beta-lactamase superfamily II)
VSDRPTIRQQAGVGWPAELDRTGIDPGDVDTVVLTHLHADHVDWAALPDGTPLQLVDPAVAPPLFDPGTARRTRTALIREARRNKATPPTAHLLQPFVDLDCQPEPALFIARPGRSLHRESPQAKDVADLLRAV